MSLVIGGGQGTAAEIVVTVHGVESDGEWQETIRAGFDGVDRLHYRPYAYGRFPWWNALSPFARRRAAENFYIWLCGLPPFPPASVIAHSYGTLLLAEVLKTYPVAFHRVVLCGSVVDKDYDWPAVMGHRVLALRNETSGGDWVARALATRFGEARLVKAWLRLGGSGSVGFSRTCDGVEHHHYPFYAHSTQFVTVKHCIEYWVPFIRNTRPFRDLCRQCLEPMRVGQEPSFEAFDARYEVALQSAIRSVFRGASPARKADYYKVIRFWIVDEGSKGVRTFDELANHYVRRLGYLLRDRL